MATFDWMRSRREERGSSSSDFWFPPDSLVSVEKPESMSLLGEDDDVQTSCLLPPSWWWLMRWEETETDGPAEQDLLSSPVIELMKEERKSLSFSTSCVRS